MPVHQPSPLLLTMGEDRYKTNGSVVEKKSNGVDSSCVFRNGDHSVPNSSTMSTCSEVNSESTGFVDEDSDQGEYQYGPGIVSKLRTKFLSITLKQNRGVNNGMRRSCSLENILDQKTTVISNVNPGYMPTNRFVSNGKGSSNGISAPWTTLKRAKSMDTLLMTLEKEQQDALDAAEKSCTEPKLIRRTEGALSRATFLITEEEFPKPDTVKTYKRMFEPAESKKTNSNSNVRRKPPVLRATAKSGTSNNKMNGVASQKLQAKSISSAKESFKDTAKPEPHNLKSVSKEVDELNKKNASLPVDSLGKRNFSPSANALNKKPSSPGDTSVKKNFSSTVGVLIKKNINESEANKACGPLLVEAPSRKNLISSIDTVTKKNPKPPISKKTFIKVEESEPKIPDSPVVSPCKINTNSTIDSQTKNSEVVSTDLKCNGTVRAEAIHIKVKEEIAKRNLRSNSKTNDAKPSPPLRKPTTKLSVPQTTKVKSSPAAPPEKPNLFQKPILKSTTSPINGALATPPVKTLESPKPVESKPQTETISNKITTELPLSINKKEQSTSKPLVNGLCKPDVVPETVSKTKAVEEPVPSKVQTHTNGPKRIVPPSNGQHNSMVFDFRGKDVVAHVSLSPAPFGCKPALVRKRSVLIDGKESAPHLNGLSYGNVDDSEDEDYVDYSIPGPCGLVFEGENVVVGKGAILSKRNKDLKIKFDEDVEKSTFVYPSESSFLSEDSSLMSTNSSSSSLDSTDSTPIEIPRIANSPKLPSNTAVNSGSGGLMTYTPSVLRTVDNFQPGLFRAPEEKKKKAEGTTEGEEENHQTRNQNGVEGQVSMLKPADPEYISSWSISAGTSDLLF